MKKKIPKTEARKQIDEFFEHVREKTPKEIKKAKRLAMSYNIKLGEKRKLFCKKCFSPFIDPSIRIKNNKLMITCEKCEYVTRLKFDDRKLPKIGSDSEEGCC